MTVESKKPGGSSVRSFRIENSNIELLEREARARDVSPNAIVNELIEKDLRRARGLRGVKNMVITAYTLRLLTERIPPEAIIEIAEKNAKDHLIRNIPRQQWGSMSAKSILETIKLDWECDETEIDGKKVIIVQLFCGRNFSFFFGETFKHTFASVGVNVKYTYDDDATVFEFDTETSRILSASSASSQLIP